MAAHNNSVRSRRYWSRSQDPDDEENSLEEEVLDNSVVNKIIDRKFVNPLMTSDDSDQESPTTPINYNAEIEMPIYNLAFENALCKRMRKMEGILADNGDIHVAGLKPPPEYLQLSALSFKQHFSILRVLAEKFPTVLEDFEFKSPDRQDHKNVVILKSVYDKEQSEFLEWARELWRKEDCFIALKPVEIVEDIYSSDLAANLHNILRLQPHYSLLAEIKLKPGEQSPCTFTHEEDLVTVNIMDLPEMNCPDLNRRRTVFISRPILPHLCERHPSQFILPDEKETSELPIDEVYEYLARFAARHNASFIMSEGAATRLVEHDRSFKLPVYSRKLLCTDGEVRNIVVIGSEIIDTMQPARYRNYNAIQYLMHMIFLRDSLPKDIKTKRPDDEGSTRSRGPITRDSLSTDEETDLANEFSGLGINDSEPENETVPPAKRPRMEASIPVVHLENIFKCNCDESPYEKPPNRSYKRWRLNNNGDYVDVIIHCAHKCQVDGLEYILESIPEYQLHLAGTMQSEHKLRSLALSLFLRNNATLLNVRVDASNGDIVTYDHLNITDVDPDGEAIAESVHIFHTVFKMLKNIRSGQYMLTHEARNEGNIKLSAACHDPVENGVSLTTTMKDISIEEEFSELLTPPNLGPVFLPFHKYRKILPLAFPCDKQQIVNSREFNNPVNNLFCNGFWDLITEPANVRAERRSRGTTRRSRARRASRGTSGHRSSKPLRPSSAPNTSTISAEISTSAIPSTSASSTTTAAPNTSAVASTSAGTSTSTRQRYSVQTKTSRGRKLIRNQRTARKQKNSKSAIQIKTIISNASGPSMDNITGQADVNTAELSGTLGVQNVAGASGTSGVQNAGQMSGTSGAHNVDEVSGTFGVQNMTEFSGASGCGYEADNYVNDKMNLLLLPSIS